MEEREAFQSIVAKFRSVISHYLPEYEKTIGLTAPNQEFRSKLTDAIIACAFQHRLMPFLKRRSDLRKELEQATKQARIAQNNLRGLADILDGLPQALSDQSKHRGLLNEIVRNFLEREIPWLEQVSVITSMYAKLIKRDQGGAPKMRAFEVLARRLADAYQTAKGKRGITWNPHGERWDGEFVKLVEDVIPLASKLAPSLRSPKALGKYLDNLIPRTRKKKSKTTRNVKNPKRTS